MERSKLRTVATIMLFTFVTFISSHYSNATTSKAVSEANEKADKLSELADEREQKIITLEKKLEESTNKLNHTRINLESLVNASSIDQIKLSQYELSLKRLTRKVEKLKKKLVDARVAATETRERADSAVVYAQRLGSERQYEVTRRQLEENRQLLNIYKAKVSKLEESEREARAEVIASDRISQMADGQWKRWQSNLNKTISETKANSILEELRAYREKVASTERELQQLSERFAESEAEYEKFQANVTN